jgi:hypothetical protein
MRAVLAHGTHLRPHVLLVQAWRSFENTTPLTSLPYPIEPGTHIWLMFLMKMREERFAV